MEEKLPIYSLDKEIKRERKEAYTDKMINFYPKAKKLTADDYWKIKYQLDKGNIKILRELMEKSIYSLIEAVADVYSRYDIEDILPLEESLSSVLCKFNEKVNTFTVLPTYYSEYTHSILSKFVYLEISRKYNEEMLKASQTDLMQPQDLAYILDQNYEESAIDTGIIKEDFYKTLKKVGKYLTDKEMEYLILRFGLISGKEMSCQEIADKYNITRGGIYEEINNAIAKLRKNKATLKLLDYESDLGI